MTAIGCARRDRHAFSAYAGIGRGRFAFGEDVLGPADFCGVVGVNRDEDVAFLKLAFVALGFDFWDAQADQPTGDAADSGPDGRTTQRGHDWSGCNERPYSRNCES